jgi:PPM family protein phosphatase
MVRFDAFSASNSIGSGHSENQDSFLADMSTMLFAVADGVGGYQGGKEASELAVAALRNMSGMIQNEITARSVLEDIHEQLLHTAKSRNYRNMGTTIALTKIFPDFQTGRGGKVLTANVGDSPILLFPNSQIEFSDSDYRKVFTDDSFRDKAPGSMWAIVQYLGIESQSEIEVHTQSLDYSNGDIILLCSDGISDNLLGENTYSRRKGVGDISEIVRKTGSARRIVEEAIQAGLKADDMTALLVFL